jgi:hypothetical protein
MGQFEFRVICHLYCEVSHNQSDMNESIIARDLVQVFGDYFLRQHVV